MQPDGQCPIPWCALMHRSTPRGLLYMTSDARSGSVRYPQELTRNLTLRDGTRVVIRPIRPEDRQIEKEFVQNLSDEARYFRFLNAIRELNERMLTQFTRIDYFNEMALIAVIQENEREIEIGVARYIVDPDGKNCEFAIVIADAWQGRGIGSRLMVHLMEAAQNRGLETMEGLVLASNHKMLSLMAALGFRIEAAAGEPTLRRVVKELGVLPAAGVPRVLG